MRLAKKGPCDHLDRLITETARNREGLLAKFDCRVEVATSQALDHHEGGDPPQPPLVPERPREHLRLLEMNSRARQLAARKERIPQVDVEVNRQLGRIPGL